MENLNKCEKWLHELLSKHNITEIGYIREQAKEAGFRKSELKQAKKTIGAKTWHYFDEKQDTGNWYWYLPENFNA